MSTKSLQLRLFPILCTLFSYAFAANAQTPSPTPEPRPASSPTASITKEHAEQQFRKWQRRVDDFTKEIVSESSAVPDSERAVYLALLAKAWWKVDEAEARLHLNKAADKLQGVIGVDEKAQPGMRLFHFQMAMEVIASLDAKLAQKVIASLEKFAGDSNEERKPDEEMANMLVSVGFKVVDTNPQMAMAFGMDSLRYGFATRLPALAVEINLKEPLLAESLVRNALTAARTSTARSSYLMLFNLDRYMSEFNKGKSFPEALRRSVVEIFMEVVATAAAVEQERPLRCKVALYSTRFVARVAEYFPANATVFNQNLQTCIPFTSETNQERVKTASEAELKSPDDLIRAARATNDLNLKIMYYRDALKYYEDKKQYDEMISILDGTDGDDLKAVAPIVWDDWRSGASSDAALAAFETKDLPAAYRYIDKTPKRLRPYVRKALVTNSSVAKNKEFLLENLEEMQKELNSLDFPTANAARLYLLLTRLYITARPTESEATFRNAVKYINKNDGDNLEFSPDKDWAIFLEYAVPMKSELLEIDEASITTSLNNLSSRRSRVRLKLGFLEPSLKEYVAARKTLDDLTKKLKPATKAPPKQ
ncbi:MAG: hypothetical protein WBO10_06620 [Pyrinomonadaceae bacterium]